MRLIQALRLAQQLNESNIGDLINGLQEIEASGRDITDKQKSKISHIINSSEEGLSSLLSKLTDCNISQKVNRDVYKQIAVYVENDSDWHTVISTFLNNRDKVGITFDDFKSNDRINLFAIVKQKYGFGDELDKVLKDIASFSSGGSKISQGPLELFLALAGKDGKLDNGRAESGDKGDVRINGAGLEIKCTNIKEDHIAKRTGEIGNNALTSGGVLLPVHDKNKRTIIIEKALNAFNQTLSKIDSNFSAKITMEGLTYKNLSAKLIAAAASIQGDEAQIKKAVATAYIDCLMSLFNNEEKKAVTNIVTKSIKSSLKEMVSAKSIISPEAASLITLLAGAATLKHYKSIEGFRGILIASNIEHLSDIRAVFLGEDLLNLPTAQLAQALTAGKLRFMLPRLDKAGRDGIQVIAN